MNNIFWKTEKRKLSDLVPASYNPRKLTEKQYQNLKDSLEKFGLAEIPAINTDNLVLAGHQRLKVLTDIFGKDHEIDVRVPNRKLTDAEAKEYNIRSNKNTGEWDWDILANDFEITDLIDWGFKEEELTGLNDDIEIDDFYTKKIDTPTYTPTGEKPELPMLFNNEKTKQLIKKIENSKIDKKLKDFLTFAAYRHTIFDYKNIAEYYAHSEKEVQELFEDSALVIIDFKKAIDDGYVVLSEKIEEEYLKIYEK